LVILQGPQDWQYQIWQQWLLQADPTKQNPLYLQIDQTTSQPKSISISDHQQITQLSPQACRHLLGQEADQAFFSLQSPAGIDLNALGIVTGLLTPGGLCFIGLPEQPHPNPASQRWISFPHQLQDCQAGFYHHLVNGLQRLQTTLSAGILWLKEKEAFQVLPVFQKPIKHAMEPQLLQPTKDQQKVLDAIIHVAFGHRHRPLVVTADRGRGKSAVLGMAAAACLLQGKNHIGITASRKPQVHTVLYFCQYFLSFWAKNPEKMPKNLKHLSKSPAPLKNLSLEKGNIQFYAPDSLLNPDNQTTSVKLDLLLVDEAASLPLPILQQLLTLYPRLVFTTTLHGYEGSGRGFGLRFVQLLEAYQWRQLELKKPIRWAEQDPLEIWLNDLLLSPKQTQLKAIKPINKSFNSQSLKIESIPTQTLWQKPYELQAIFELLARAHYQTQPNDLLQLLEAPHLKLWVLRKQNTNANYAFDSHPILAVLLATEEGGLPNNSNNHFQGHLIPQQLFQQTQNAQWRLLKSWRIVRLAVAADAQQQGLGTQLVQTCLQQAKAANLDAVTCSFGATAELVQFWLKQDFMPLYLGLKKDAASGTHSLSMMAPLSKKALQLSQQQQTHYRAQFAHLLSELPFNQLPVALVSQIAQGLNYPKIDFPKAYLQGQPFEALSWQLKQWSLAHPKFLQQLPQAFCQKVCQSHNWTQLPQSRKQQEQLWKDQLKKMI